MTHYQALTHLGGATSPLVFAFHGTGGDESQFFGLAREMMPEASIISPRGDVSEMGAARFFRRTGEGVYDMDDLARRTATMADYMASHKQEGQKVYAFGYSNGANILASVMMAHPGLVDRAGLLHPLIPWDPAPVDLSGTQVLITAGQRDPICPWPMSQRLIDWFGGQGASVTTEVHDGGHELRQSEITALHRLLTEEG